jgi:hypothetical protein
VQLPCGFLYMKSRTMFASSICLLLNGDYSFFFSSSLQLAGSFNLLT